MTTQQTDTVLLNQEVKSIPDQPCADGSLPVLTASASALLPCPFCGGAADIHQIGNEATKSRGFEVECVTWGCKTRKRAMVIRQPLEVARRFVIDRWNSRADGRA